MYILHPPRKIAWISLDSLAESGLFNGLQRIQIKKLPDVSSRAHRLKSALPNFLLADTATRVSASVTGKEISTDFSFYQDVYNFSDSRFHAPRW